MARASAERIPLGRTPWHCDPNYIVCPDDHLMTFYEAGYRADLRRLNGHSFLECRTCAPASYFLAVFTALPSPMVTCYEISRESYQEWTKTDEPTPPTPELLHRLRDPDGRSHNPYWRPTR